MHGSKNEETVGSASYRLSLKNSTTTHTPIEQMREQLSEYEKEIVKCYNRYKSVFLGDFYVVVAVKREKLMPNVLRNMFFGTKACPTPNYDQTVYKYNRIKDELELLWVLPDRESSIEMRDHSKEVPPEMYTLLSYVLSFNDGSLFELAKHLNGESNGK